MIVRIAFPLFALVVAASPAWAAQVGKPAPTFSLKALDGSTHKLEQYRGKTVVLEWFNPDCPFVVKAHEKAGVLQTMAAQQAKNKVVWLAVNSSAPGRQGHGVARNKAAVKNWKMNHPVLIDEKGTVGRAYGAKTTPHMFVIDAKGTLVYKGGPDNAGYGAPAGGVKPYLADALKSIKAGKKISQSSTKPWGCSVKY